MKKNLRASVLLTCHPLIVVVSNGPSTHLLAFEAGVDLGIDRVEAVDGEGDRDPTINEVCQTESVFAAPQRLDVGRAAGWILGQGLPVDQDLDPADIGLQRFDRAACRHERDRDEDCEEGHCGKFVWVFPVLSDHL